MEHSDQNPFKRKDHICWGKQLYFKKEVELEVPLRDGFGDIAGEEVSSRPEVSQNRGKSERKAEGRVEEEPGFPCL